MLFTIFPKHKGRVNYPNYLMLNGILPLNNYVQYSGLNIISEDKKKIKNNLFQGDFSFEVNTSDKVLKHKNKKSNNPNNNRSNIIQNSSPEIILFEDHLFEVFYMKVFFENPQIIDEFKQGITNSSYLRDINLVRSSLNNKNLISQNVNNFVNLYKSNIKQVQFEKELFRHKVLNSNQNNLERILHVEEFEPIKKIKF